MPEPRPPKASAAKVAYHARQLSKTLARADDTQFLQLVWAIDALQSGRSEAAGACITYPPQAADTSINSAFAIHRWELETLIVQLFLTEKQEISDPALIVDCTKFDTMRATINRLRSLENVDAAFYLADDAVDIHSEMHRIAQRQFHWQRGYFNLAQFYRYLFIYGQGECAGYFQERYGISTSQLALTAFAYFATFQRSPWVARTELPALGLTNAVLECALPMVSMERNGARQWTTENVARINEEHGRPVPTAYLPSVLRRSPLIFNQANPNRYIAPIPEVVLMRTTSGLYYDLIGGGQALLNEANDRFEEYCQQYLSTMMPRFQVQRAFRYGPAAAPVDTPDVLVQDDERIVLAIECKATKLTYLAQFAEDPFEAQRRQYQQISRGIFQLWRYFSHIRLGLLPLQLAPSTFAMVLTLDPFAMMSRGLRANILAEARRLADENGNIIEADRRHVLICPIAELEQVLHSSNEDIFLGSLQAAQEERYRDWQFREIHRDTDAGRNYGAARPFPFDLGQLLPWWGGAQQVAAD